MRTWFIVLLSFVMLTALIATSALPAAGAPSLTPINLTKDRAVEKSPSIRSSPSGDVVVAWEQNVTTNGVTQPDIYARVLQNGAFGPRVNISNDLYPSHAPFLFPAGSTMSALYQVIAPGTGYVARSDWSGAAWSAPQNIAGGDYASSITPVGVQASDGTTWVARWVPTVGSRSDIIVQQIGGPSFNVSNDGRAWRNPFLVAGDNGSVYVAWIDHSYVPSGFVPGIRLSRVTTAGAVALPQPTIDFFAYWCRLAYYQGRIYVVWLATTQGWVRQRVWDGTTWGRQSNLGQGDKPRLALTTGGNVYVTWEKQGQIFLKQGPNAPLMISGTTSYATQADLTADNIGNAHVAFASGGDIWYVRVPPP